MWEGEQEQSAHLLVDQAIIGSSAVDLIQVEMHPMWRQSKLRAFCKDYNIDVSAYSALGGPGNYWFISSVQNPIIQSIALKHNATPAQIALRWGLSKVVSVIMNSFSKERLKENIGALDVELEDDYLLEIEQIEQWKIMRGEYYVNQTTSPYRTIKDLWDGEIDRLTNTFDVLFAANKRVPVTIGSSQSEKFLRRSCFASYVRSTGLH